MKFYPLKFEDIFKEKVWGGRSLKDKLNKSLPAEKKIGESWEISGYKDSASVVKNGPLRGQKLNKIIRAHAKDILGEELAKKYSYFPLLIKFIDANDKLSIQVHPNDKYAEKYEHALGKTESWYVVSASPHSKIICGLKDDLKKKVSKEDIKEGIAHEDLEDYLNEFEVREGDVIYIPSKTVHAIEAGILIYEVQETSDITYRLYDWGRVGLDGKPRRLDISKSLRVMNLRDYDQHKTKPITVRGENYKRDILVGCEYFVMERYEISGKLLRQLDDGFEVLTALSGKGNIMCDDSTTEIACGETALIPAAIGEYEIKSTSDGLAFLVTYKPKSTEDIRRRFIEQGINGDTLHKLGGLR